MPSRSVTITLGAGVTGAGIAQFGSLLNEIGNGLRDSQPLTTELTKTKTTIQRNLRASVPDADLSGDGRGPLGVRQTVKATSRGSSQGLQATGPWQLIEYNTRPHRISPRNGRALRMSNGGYATGVNHPGTKGKAIWRKSVNGADNQLKKAGSVIVENAIQLTAATATTVVGISLLGSGFKRGII